MSLSGLPDDFIVVEQYSGQRRFTRVEDGFNQFLRQDGEWIWDDSVCNETAARWFCSPDVLVAVVVRDDSQEVKG
jgi:hypothetical protein